MVATQIAARGIDEPHVIRAMQSVPREAFVPDELTEFAYDDTPLPIPGEQTISQPFIVAAMIAAAHVKPGERVLEIGTGSGYAAAVLAEIGAEVYTIERKRELADGARERLAALGYGRVHVLLGDGTLGWKEHAPYDAIVVAASGPSAPEALLEQLRVGGRLVIPIGETPRTQRLVRFERSSETNYARKDLGSVRFVPLIGAQAWPELESAPSRRLTPAGSPLSRLIREEAERIDDIESVSLAPLLERIGDARVVLLGEATHGTSEFYRMRARISRELIQRRGFSMVAVEADWPDAAVVDRYLRHLPATERSWKAFTRFPTWMWRNRETLEFVEWLREYNRDHGSARSPVSFHGLDLYSLYTSCDAVIRYLDRVDPIAGKVGRERYGCLTPWENDPATYGRAALTPGYRACEREIVGMLQELLQRRLEYAAKDGEDYFDAVQNARVVANAERYYRVMYYGSVASWNLRDQHMFDTLQSLLDFRGRDSKIVVWEHNSHIGDASATEMRARGEHNVGQLCRTVYGDLSYSVGFGTDRGTVAAASEWDRPMEIVRVRPSVAESYERLFHASGVPALLLHLRQPRRVAVREELTIPRLERAIGVVYKPGTEMASHYFEAVLPRQFDEYCWFDETTAITPLSARREPAAVPDTYPFGL